MLSDSEREEVRVELARRKRILVGLAVFEVVALVAMAALGASLTVVGFALIACAAHMALLARHYQRTVAACRANGY